METVKTKDKFFSGERKARLIIAILVSLSLALVLFVVAPLDIFAVNLEEFNFSFSDFALYLFIFAIVNAILIFVLLFFIPRKGYRVILALLIATGLLLIIQQNFLNFNMTSLPGDNISSELPVWQIIVDAAVWIGGYTLAVVLVTRKDDKGRIQTTALILAVIMFAMEFVSVLSVIITNPDMFTDKLDRMGDGFEVLTFKNYTDIGGSNNVFYFVVDRFDEDFAEETYNADESVFSDLDGFTWYQDNIANYGHTFPAIANMLTNKPYSASSLRAEYLDNVYEGDTPLKSLNDKGYNINLYTQPYYSFTEAQRLPDYVLNKGKAVSVKSADKSTFALNMAYFSLYRGLPLIFKKHLTFGSTASINSLTIFNGEIDGKIYSGYNADTKEAYFEMADNSFNSVAGGKQFSFIHIAGCHGEDYNEDWGNGGDIKSSVINSFKLVKGYIAQMKEQGVYDNATIIITGDHSDPHFNNNNISEPRLTALFVKKSGDTGKFRTSAAQTSHNDIWATIFESEGLDKTTLGEGYSTSVFDVSENMNRTRNFVWHTYSLDCDEYFWEITGQGKNFSNWNCVEQKHYNKFIMN